ncbi:MAG: LysM peptidoglycan-binding domain-containing protein [Leptospiraceae bacterium]|nr:LysM peptidoglycan-binding domain-containing protein [Leptospiraceae bacterium]
MLVTKLRIPATVLALSCLIAGFTACSKSIPVQELSDAQMQLDLAAQEKADQYAPEKYNAGREALLGAHQNLESDDYEGAKTRAIEARDLALEARETAAPKDVAEKKTAAEQGLADADEAYAEKLAPRDFAAAQELLKAGNELQQTAEQKSGDETLPMRRSALSDYHQAARKFQDSIDASERARNLALSQKDDMLDSLDGVRRDLERAEMYGAGESHQQELADARALLADAETEINSGRLKDGSETMAEAEKAAANLLAMVESDYAEKKLVEAREAVSKAESHYKTVNTDNNRKQEETAAILGTLGSQVNAAGEALSSADNYYKGEKYQDSINESEEAIRLSKIIFEQSNLIAQAQNRDLNDIGRGGEENAADNTEVPQGWQTYTVKRETPADCLWRIARDPQHYGSGYLWRRIYQANQDRIRNPNLIFPGQVLRIPPKEGDISNPPADSEESPAEESSMEDSMREEAEDELNQQVEELEQEAENSADEMMEQPQEN